MKGELNPKLTSLLNAGGVHDLQNPAGPDGPRPTPSHPSAGCWGRPSGPHS